ncbi:uncharacterized protein LOC135344431 isoform X2 [Halichondria panicea]|uniref:uncharacterized protein LOC135344431 isoform X2 n=1 Tax=Halichondria panicea TaxID=6063 RepID=UPI00312B3E41
MSQEPSQKLSGGITPEPPVEMPPAHIAVTRNNVDQLSELVASGEILVDPGNQETVLHAAVRAGSGDAVKYILREKLVSPTALSVAGHTAAHYAALYNQLDLLKVVLTYDSGLSHQLAHQTDETGLSLLSLAALGGNKDMAEWLLEGYPDLANVANSNGNLPVHFAAAQGQLSIVKLLVTKCGRDMAETQDSRQTRPVYFAAQEGRMKVLDYLINELGVDGVAKDKDNMSCVHAATQGNHPTTVKWLVNKLGTSFITDKTTDGATPLHMAASQGNLDILRFFLDRLENEGDVNIQDSIQATPAHDAAEFGQTQAMILLLKAGADLSIQDYVNKTPQQLAVEQEHTELANLISDYRKGGLPAIAKYEKRKKRSREDDREKGRSDARTSRQEAMELSTVIQATAEVVDKRREQTLQRQESLKKMNEVGLEDQSKEPLVNGGHGNGGRGRSRGRGRSAEENDIEHHLGPLGGIYARPNKTAGRSKSGSKHNSDIEDFIDETMSHRSYSSHKHRSPPYRMPPGMEEGPYTAINHETASNVSRPSRVKRYHDSDSEVSSFAGSAGHFYHSGHYPMPMGGGYGQFPPPLPPPRGTRSIASSKGSSYAGGAPRMPPYGGMPYGYLPNMYYGYHPPYAGGPGYPPQAGSRYPPQGGPRYPPQHYGMPMYGPPPGLYLQRHRLHHQQMVGRKAQLLNKKKKKGQTPSYDASAEHSGTHTPRKHTDQDMGYGPSMLGAKMKAGDDHVFHPPAPPITQTDGSMEAHHEVVPHDSNFIMAKRTDDGSTIRKIGETTLNPNQHQREYDGRYDKYIMTDSESDTDLPEHVGVACAAESVAIVAIGCVAGLRGLAKMRKDKPSKVVAASDKPRLSSAWDDTLDRGGSKGQHEGSSTAIDDPLLRGMSPEEFASHEEWERSDWDQGSGGGKKKKKTKKRDKKSSAEVKGQTTPGPVEPQSDLLAAEIHKHASASVSKGLGEQILFSALGARHSSMLDIAASVPGSRISLNMSSEGEDDDDDFNTAISMVTGTPLKGNAKLQQSKSFDLSAIGKEAEEPKKKKKKKERATDSSASDTKKKEKKNRKGKEKKEQTEQEKRQQEQKDLEQKEKLKKEQELREIERREQEKRDRKEQEKQELERREQEKRGRKEQEKQELVRREQEKKDRKEQEKALKVRKEQEKKERREQEKREKQEVKVREKELKAQAKKEKKITSVEVKAPLVSTTLPGAPPTEPHRSPPTSQVSDPTTFSITPREDQKPTQRKFAPPPPVNTGPKEVANKVTMFDTESESESEDEKVKVQKPPKTTGGFDMVPKPVHPPPPQNEVHYIESDDQSLDIFGVDGLAELNDALRELSNIQSYTEPTPVPAKKVSVAVTVATKQRESTRSTLEKGVGFKKTSSGGSGSSGSGRGQLPNERRGNPPTGGRVSGGMTVVGTGTNANLTSTNIQEGGYSSNFEENVLNILKGLTDTMQQMRSNPSVTQSEIKQQEILQQQMIQNLISYSENNPQLTSKLLLMLKQEQKPTDYVQSDATKSAFEMLEQKLLEAQEVQSRHAKDYIRTQEEFQQAMYLKLEEQAQQQLKLIQSNFEKYSHLLNERTPKKKKKSKSKSKSKNKHKRQSSYSDDGTSSESDDGLVQPMKQTSVSKPAVRTMQARIYHQDMLDEESMRTSSSSSLTGKLREKKLSRDKLRKQDTSLNFDRTTEALKRFESVTAPIDEDDDDDDEMQHAQRMRPVTLKKADIMKISKQREMEKAVTFNAAAVVNKSAAVVSFSESSQQQSKAHMMRIGGGGPEARGPRHEKPLEKFDSKYGNHVETNEHKKNLQPVDSTIEGAGGELANILKNQQQRIENRD